MEDRTHALVAIVFLAVLCSAAAFIAYWMLTRPAAEKIYRIETTYSVSGLTAQAPVNFKGVKVGTVEQVELDPDHPGSVRIRIAVAKDTPITGATFAELATQGLTGSAYIALDDDGKPSEPLATSSAQPSEIPMHRSLMQSLEHSGKQVMAQAGQVEESLQALLDPSNRARVARLLDRLDEVSRKLVALQDALLPTARELPGLVAQTRDAVAQSRRLAEQLRVDARSVSGLGRSADALSQQLQEQTLPRIDVLIQQLDRTAEHVDELSRTLERQPQSILFGASPPPPGPGEPGFQAPPAREAP